MSCDALISGGQLGRVVRPAAQEPPAMSRSQARRILEQLRSGDADYSAKIIRLALIASGDLVESSVSK